MKGFRETVFILLTLCVNFTRCQNKRCECDIDTKVISKNDSLIKNYINLPLDEQWAIYNEPNLYEIHNSSYRMTVRESFLNYFRIYRIEKQSKKYTLYYKGYRTDIRGNDSLITDVSKSITKREWPLIERSFIDNCFWVMPVDIEKNHNILDGIPMTLEAHCETNNCTNANYHFVFRVSPEKSDFISICDLFMELDTL
jgi:hypothetical protein